uniref:Pyroglutamyl-peptidase I n=1 Tax=Ovis aries TaxID=9940 RepID=A0AC11EGE7_SHEEP
MGGEGAEGGALGWMSAGTFLFCRESGALLFSEDRSAYPQRLCYPCSLDLRPQHFLCFCFQELEKLGLGDSVDLHVYEIPVEYQTVQRLIPALWEKHSPQVSGAQLVVHVGVSGMATAVTLEKCGHNKGYKGLDNCRFCPGSQCCVEDGPESIDSIIDMDAVCKRVTTLGLDVSVTISQDAGRYLCDFTYYTSLYQSHGRSAFVHVPPLGKPYNADQLGRALRAIIEEMLDLLEQSEGKINCCHEH